MKSIISELSPLGFGGASLSGEGRGYGFGSLSENDANTLLNQIADWGIKVIDLAPIYGMGLAEQRVGKYLKNRRDDFFIISKGGVDWHDNGRVNMSNNPKVLQKMLEKTLIDLQTDYIDCYMIHWPDNAVDIRYAYEVLAKAWDKKIIRYIGLSNTNSHEITKAKEIAPIHLLQGEGNYWQEELNTHGLPFTAWGTFDKGILTQRVTENRKFEKCDARSWAPWWKKGFSPEKLEKVEKLKAIANSYNHSLLEVCLGHNLRTLEVTTTLVGSRCLNQWKEVINAMENYPTQEILDKIRSTWKIECQK